MTKYLISFPSEAMVLTEEEFVQAGIDSRAVVQEAKDAGVWVFGGGINDGVPPVRVSSDGVETAGTYSPTSRLDGGYSVFELPNREEAVAWAAKIAKACRCDQELREFHYDPES